MAEPQYPQTKIPLPVAKPRGIKPSQYRTTPTELEELFQQSLPAAVADIPVEEAMQALPPEEEPKPVTFVPTPDPKEVAEARAVGIAKRAAERKAIAKKVKDAPGALLGTTVSILESVGEMVDPTPSLDQRKLAHRLKKSRKAKARKKALEGKDFTIAKALPEKLVAYEEKDIIEPEREKKMIQAYRLGIDRAAGVAAAAGINKGFRDAEKETAKRLKEMHWIERSLGDLGDVVLAIPQLAGTAITTQDPKQTGKDLAVGMAGGTAHVFRHPLDSFESRPFMTLLTWIPALRVFGGAARVAGATQAGKAVTTGATQAGKAVSAGMQKKFKQAEAVLIRNGADELVKFAKKTARGTAETHAQLRRIWFDGMYQRTEKATLFVEELLKAPDEAAGKVKTKVEQISKDIERGKFKTEENLAKMRSPDESSYSYRPATETTKLTIKERVGKQGEKILEAEPELDAFKEPVKVPLEKQGYDIHNQYTNKLVDDIAADVIKIKNLTPKHLQDSGIEAAAIKNAVRASLAAVIYDHSAAFFHKGSSVRKKIINNIIKTTEGLKGFNTKQLVKDINSHLDNPTLTRAIVAGEDLTAGIVPEISFRNTVIFNQRLLASAIHTELKAGLLSKRKGFINRVKAEAMMRVGEDIANQTKKGTQRNLIEGELLKTKPDRFTSLAVLEERAANAAKRVVEKTAEYTLVEDAGRAAFAPEGPAVVKARASLDKAQQKLNEFNQEVIEKKANPNQELNSTAEKFIEEAIIGKGEVAPHAPMMIEVNPADLANQLTTLRSGWLEKNKLAIEFEGRSRGLSSAEAISDALISFDDVVRSVKKYRLLPEGTLGKNRPVYADAGVAHTLIWEQRARNTLEGALMGKGALGSLDWAMSQMKANLTVRNLPTHVNNFTANLALQMLRRGDPTIVIRQFAILEKWLRLRGDRPFSGDVPRKLDLSSDSKSPIKKFNKSASPEEFKSLKGKVAYVKKKIQAKEDMERLDAIAKTNLIDTDMVQHEIGAVGGSWNPITGKPLQKGYMWGDQIFKLEEALSVMRKADEAFTSMSAGDWIDLVITPRRTQTLWKRPDGAMSKTEGGVALTKAEINFITAKAGGHSALKLFFDYSDVSTMVKFLKTSRVLSLASPFYTWFWKAMTTGKTKGGLIGETIAGPTTFKTNSKAVNWSQIKQMGLLSLRRTVVMQGFLGEIRKDEDKASRRKLYKYLPREVASHIVTELQDPTYSEGISVRGMNYASPQMIVLRGIGSAIVNGGAMFGDYKEEELYPKLPDGSTDFELKSVRPVQREDILKRRRLWGMNYRNELFTYDQALEIAGLTGGLAVDLLTYVKDGEKDKRKHVDLASMWTQYGKILVGGVVNSAISYGASEFDQTNPWTSRRYGLKPQDPALTEDFTNWAMGQAFTSLLKRRKVNTAQAVHKIVREGKAAMKLNLVKRSKDKIKNLRQQLKKAYGDGDDKRADEIEKYIEQVAITMGRTNSIINHQAVEVKKRFIDSLTVFK